MGVASVRHGVALSPACDCGGESEAIGAVAMGDGCGEGSSAC